MTHEVFRMLVPGLIFWLPVFAVSILRPDGETDLGIIGSVIAAAVLPTGWLIYSGYRVLLIKSGRTYERKNFVEMVRNKLRTVYVPVLKAVVIDFSRVRPDFGKWKLNVEIFLETFCPFMKRTRKASLDPTCVKRIPFLEHLLDLSLFQDQSFDYARSISSIRYGLSCSVFAFVLGITVAAGEYLLLGWYNSETTTTKNIVGFALVAAVVLLSAFMLYWRRVYASAEYDARLNLITLSKFDFAKFTDAELESNEFSDLLSYIEATENPDSRMAVFDLDNTLVVGDIQEAVLARLLSQNKIVGGFKWSDYAELLKKDRSKAYKKSVQVMARLSVSTVEDTTRKVLEDKNPYLRLDGYEVPLPWPHPGLQKLVARLQLMGIACFVISASNEISVQICCWELFGIPPENAFGTRSRRKGRSFWQKLTPELEEPVPIFCGKVTVLERLAGAKIPVLLAGDNDNDYALLRTCPSDGKVLWVGTKLEEAKKVEEELQLHGRVTFVQRPVKIPA